MKKKVKLNSIEINHVFSAVFCGYSIVVSSAKVVNSVHGSRSVKLTESNGCKSF